MMGHRVRHGRKVFWLNCLLTLSLPLTHFQIGS